MKKYDEQNRLKQIRDPKKINKTETIWNRFDFFLFR